MEAVNHVDKAEGWIDYAATYAGAPPSGTFTLATIRLRAGEPVGNQPLRFVRSSGRMTDVLYQEESVLGNLNDAWLTATGFTLQLPVILSGYAQ